MTFEINKNRCRIPNKPGCVPLLDVCLQSGKNLAPALGPFSVHWITLVLGSDSVHIKHGHIQHFFHMRTRRWSLKWNIILFLNIVVSMMELMVIEINYF